MSRQLPLYTTFGPHIIGPCKHASYVMDGKVVTVAVVNTSYYGEKGFSTASKMQNLDGYHPSVMAALQAELHRSFVKLSDINVLPVPIRARI
jgi:hypothetical protein